MNIGFDEPEKLILLYFFSFHPDRILKLSKVDLMKKETLKAKSSIAK